MADFASPRRRPVVAQRPTSLVALAQAESVRCRIHPMGLAHHSDAGSVQIHSAFATFLVKGCLIGRLPRPMVMGRLRWLAGSAANRRRWARSIARILRRYPPAARRCRQQCMSGGDTPCGGGCRPGYGCEYFGDPLGRPRSLILRVCVPPVTASRLGRNDLPKPRCKGATGTKNAPEDNLRVV